MGDLESAEPVSSPKKPPPRKRRRIVISCTECHRRKQKCDRKEPCTNCQTRHKESACRYETGTPIAKVNLKATSPSSTNSSSIHKNHDEPSELQETTKATTAVDFGYSPHAGSTLGILRRLEGATTPLAGMPADIPSEESFDMRERYKSLIRQLPARTYVEMLVDVYFHDVNWQYFGIDEPIVRDLMDQWYSLPFNLFSVSGPLALEPMLRALPALLFQLVASALLYLREEKEKDFECLKYTNNMTFDDLSVEYSEAGMGILTLLGKRQMSVVTVMAGWCRASLLKYLGMVTEAWHQVGTCIRDAQGIGLHRDQMDPQPTPGDTSDEAMEKTWTAQQRRTVWLILMSWDLHTGAVLGRPTSVDHRQMNRTCPIDAIMPKLGERGPLVPRTDDDPPTPLTRAIWSWQIMKTLRDILDLEKEGPFPKDFTKVDKLHAELLDMEARTPPPFRTDQPDTRFDKLPECWWLPYARAQLPQLHAFNILALHRPYVFTRPVSRHAALKASLAMLESQRQQFATLDTAQHRTYSLFFGTFDAIVMVSSIYILFPREHPALLDQARQHFQWAVDRFEKMAERNHLARSALGVLQAIWIRFKKAVGHGSFSYHCSEAARAETEAATRWIHSQSEARRDRDVSTAASAHSASTQPTPNTDYTAPLSSSVTTTTTTTGQAADNEASFEWSLPTDFDFGAIMPMYPMGDIAYNDLTGILGGMPDEEEENEDEQQQQQQQHSNGNNEGMTSNWAVVGAGAESSNKYPFGMSGLHHHHHNHNHNHNHNNNNNMYSSSSSSLPQHGGVPWQFGGEFGSDTIWNLLNQFPSS